MAFESVLEEYRRKTEEALAMGGPEKLAKRKADGVLNARERIDYLIDGGLFVFVMGTEHAPGLRPWIATPRRASFIIVNIARMPLCASPIRKPVAPS